MDDHSRFITGYGLHATQSAALVIEVLLAAIGGHGVPQEILNFARDADAPLRMVMRIF